MWHGEQMALVKPWLCRSCPLNTTSRLLHMIKIPLTRVISHAFWRMWLAGCDMTQHYLLPPCATSLEALSPLRTPVSPMPRLAFQLTCSRWAAQWEDTGKGRCVYFPETKCFAATDGSAFEQMAAFDTTATQPGHLDRQSWLTFGDEEIGKKKSRCSSWNSWNFSASSSSSRPGEQFFPTRHQSTSQLTRWAKSCIFIYYLVS